VTWIKVDDLFPDHPKFMPLTDRAFRLVVETWCWSSRHLKDGAMPAAVWARQGTKKAREEVIAAGLIDVDDQGNVTIHDYLDHQRSAEEVLAARERNAINGRKGGLAKAKQSPSNLLSKTLSEGSSQSVAESETEADKSTPNPTSGGSDASQPKRRNSRADGTNPRALAALAEAAHRPGAERQAAYQFGVDRRRQGLWPSADDAADEFRTRYGDPQLVERAVQGWIDAAHTLEVTA
jgi:hypothetical protein